MSIFSGWMQWVHHVYESTGAADAYRAVMTNAAGKIDDTLLSSNVALENVANVFTLAQTFGASTLQGFTVTLADAADTEGSGDFLGAGSSAFLAVVYLGTDTDIALISGRGGGTVTVTIIHAVRSANFSNAKATAGDLNMYYTGGGVFAIQNLRGAARTINILRIR